MTARRLLAASAAGAALALSASAAFAAPPEPFVIDFEDGQGGSVANGYSVPGHPEVTFYDTQDANLMLYAGSEAIGTGLLALSDDTSAIEIRLERPTSKLSLTFGNDNPGIIDTDDYAQLTVYRGENSVGQVLVHPNVNEQPDQRIAFAGKLFDRAVFQYVDQDQQPINLIEVIDDVRVSPLCTLVGNGKKKKLTGTAGDDVICGSGIKEEINGLGGDDLIYGANGADVIKGGKGSDKLIGGRGNDTLIGGAGDDILQGRQLKDTCNGGAGTDTASTCEIVKNIP